MAALTVLFLVFLEGLLSFDNAVVLAVLAAGLPEDQQKKALTYGMWGAIGFRALALGLLVFIMQSAWIKFVGGTYLLWLALSHFAGGADGNDAPKLRPSFWKTVLAIELTDIAFSTDSILASVGVSQDYWVVFAGGVAGIMMMRLASMLFIKLLKIFPRLETSAYVLILMLGMKLIAQGFGVDFHKAEPFMWIPFALAILAGFIPVD
jgi:YkoY family integral membrane protein